MHDLKAFYSAVKYYKKHLSAYNGKSILVIGPVSSRKAFFSMAPLSRAVHELNSDMSVMFFADKPRTFEALKRVWKAYEDLKKKKRQKAARILWAFILGVEKKAQGEFEKIFQKPDLIIYAEKHGFRSGQSLQYKHSWHKELMKKQLNQTCRNIWKNVYNIKKHESVGVGFELIPRHENLGLPLDDYLDSYSICDAMIRTSPGKKVSAGSSTLRESALDFPERISELKATLLGCELEKDIDEKIFRSYRKLSKLLKLGCFRPNDASFSIHGKGYGGKHIFGECIGYPTANRKSRWPSPGGIIYKFDWYPQTYYETRKPRSRVAFTETLPLGLFIETCNVNYEALRLKNHKISRIMERSDLIKVESSKTSLTVHLKGKHGKRLPKPSDSDARFKINPLVKKRLGIEAGMMANLPGGESFLTPEYLEGTFYGDVVISVDQSYRLTEKNPLIVKCNRNGYKIIRGPKKIMSLIRKKKQDEWKQLLVYEKSRALPKEIIRTKKANFESIGEFAINTNPKAKLCRYLIVNEKLAGMIHIALGSGFDPDRDTEYHYDIVINAKKQKLDIYGVNKQKKLWIMRKGAL